MDEKEIHTRLKKFAVEIVRLVKDLPRVLGVFRIANQLVGSGTSPAANAREAAAGRSKPEFISCMGIALKEMRETELWLEILIELGWGDRERVEKLLQECRELGKILARIILNTKANM